MVLNLWRNPDTTFEALAIYHTLKNKPAPPEIRGQGALEFRLEKRKEKIKLGEALAFPWGEVQSWPAWILPCAFARSDLIRAAYNMLRGSLWLPGFGKVGEISLAPLSDFAALGPDRRDIHDGFDKSDSVTPYPALWGHDAQSVLNMELEPNAYLSPLSQGKESRPLRRVEDLWPLAGTMLLAERVRVNTQKLLSIRVSKPVLSNLWWTVSFKERTYDIAHEKALATWINSSLGILILLSVRQETEGAWIDFKKPVLANLPVLNLRQIGKKEIETLSGFYDEVCRESLRPFPQMAADPVRARIDQAVSQALGLPDFSVLRELLAREPVICLKRL